MWKFLSNGKRAVILGIMMALLCGCGRAEGGQMPGLESGAARESGNDVQSGRASGDQKSDAAPARERISWGTHEPVYENGKEVLTFGAIGEWNIPEELIAAYNQQSEKYIIRAIDYYDEEKEYDASLTALQLDIVRGQAPDILSLSGIDYYPWAEKGILEDLYSYIDADDQLGREDFVGSVLDAYTVEGCGKDQNGLWGFAVEEPVLTDLCIFSMNDFVDWDKGTCDFTGEDFKQILRFCKDYQGKALSGSITEAVRSDEVLLLVQLFHSVGSYQLAEEMFGEPITCVGYPTVGGSGTIANMIGRYAINAAAANKDGCWDFLKYVLENEDEGAFPVLRRRFDNAMQQAMTEDLAEGESGAVPKAGYGELWVYAASQEQVDAFRALVDSADRPCQYHKTILNIISEEAEDYFNDRKSLEDTVAVIQSRVGIYVAE